MELTIDYKDQKQFQKLFQFFSKEECEVSIFPEGLKYRNKTKEMEGIVYKTAFAEYPFNFRRPIAIFHNNIKALNNWIKKWKVKDNFIKIPV